MSREQALMRFQDGTIVESLYDGTVGTMFGKFVPMSDPLWSEAAAELCPLYTRGDYDALYPKCEHTGVPVEVGSHGAASVASNALPLKARDTHTARWKHGNPSYPETRWTRLLSQSQTCLPRLVRLRA